MAVRTDKSLFYHIPKTGGIWVKEAMRKSGLRYERCKDQRGAGHPFGLKREHAPPDIVRGSHKRGLFSFCFVRHPVSWYKSFWAYRVKTRYLDEKFPLDRIWDDVFEKFIINVLDAFPGGFVTRLYQYYVGEDMKGVDFIGRQERLADDLVKTLRLAGETFDEERLRKTRWRNVSAQSKKFRRLCALSDETHGRVLESERWVIDNFYERRWKPMAKAVIYFWDEIEERTRRKKLRGQDISHEVKDGVFTIKVDDSVFTIKEENLKSCDIKEDQ